MEKKEKKNNSPPALRPLAVPGTFKVSRGPHAWHPMIKKRKRGRPMSQSTNPHSPGEILIRRRREGSLISLNNLL